MKQMAPSLSLAAPLMGGRRGVSVKTLKRALKKAGLKTTGRKAALTRRAKKAHLKLHGGVLPKRSNADGVKPGDETKGSEDTSSSSSSSESGLSNKTPDTSGVEAPSSLPSRSGGRHRRSRHSRKWAY